ncbi:hypothetical protein [Halomonas sp. AOP42-D1-22]|uniref:hypothetical protein n=1 Tax=Halomonas sp. AOP42-D1-22 TaxID=3457667 RepID=UPI0040343077
MKATLRVEAISISALVVTVKWYLGKRRFGWLNVDVSTENIYDVQDVKAIAELMSLRYLLWDSADILGSINPGSFSIMVSQPAILDVLAKKTDRHAIEPYASLLRTTFAKTPVNRLDEAEVEEEETPWPNPVPVSISEDMRSPYMIIYVEGMGRLGISERSVTEFADQHRIFSGSSPSDPFKSICDALNHRHLALYKIPTKREHEKIEKYGEDGVAQVWRNTAGNMMYIVLPKPELNVLLTCIQGSKGYLASQTFVRYRLDH